MQAMSVFETMKENDIAPSAAEYRSMLHMLSLIPEKEENKGENWEQSLALLREAQDLELRLTEVSFNTGSKRSACVPKSPPYASISP